MKKFKKAGYKNFISTIYKAFKPLEIDMINNFIRFIATGILFKNRKWRMIMVFHQYGVQPERKSCNFFTVKPI
jgi:hypothetical protein